MTYIQSDSFIEQTLFQLLTLLKIFFLHNFQSKYNNVIFCYIFFKFLLF